jgi:putative DNA primase/helicase
MATNFGDLEPQYTDDQIEVLDAEIKALYTRPTNLREAARGEWVIVPSDFTIPPAEKTRVISVWFHFAGQQPPVVLYVAQQILDDKDLYNKLCVDIANEYKTEITKVTLGDLEGKPFKTPALCYGQFELRPDGVYKIVPAKDDDEADSEIFVCSWLKVIALNRDQDSGEWGRFITWRDADHKTHNDSISEAVLAKRNTELSEYLARGGVRIGSDTHLREYIKTATPAERMLAVPRTGWHTVKNRRVFVVSKDCIIDSGSGEKITLQSESFSTEYSSFQSGDLADWQRNVAQYCLGNDVLLFAVSAAFAGPMLELLDKSSGGFHLWGKSSKGKTTALAVAASVWGRPVVGWKTTDNALENIAEAHNSITLMLDELSLYNAKDAAEAAYMLGNGHGKGRASQSMASRPTRSWRLLFLSSGELTLADHAASEGKDTKAGTEVRMVQINTEVSPELGLFQNIYGHKDSKGRPFPAGFSDSLRNITHFEPGKRPGKDHCVGVAGPAFVEWLASEPEGDLRKYFQAESEPFISERVPNDSSGEIYRVADRFVLVGVAGELATYAKITGWSQGAAMRSAMWCFQRWLDNRSVGSSDTDKAIARLRDFILANDARFEEIRDNSNNTPTPRANLLGYKRRVDNSDGTGGSFEYLFITSGFKEACGNQPVKEMAQELKRRELLRAGEASRFQVQVRVPGRGPVWLYVVLPAICTYQEGSK